MKSRRWQTDSALALIAFVWGATFVLVKDALPDVSTLLFLTLRFSIAALLMVPLALRSPAGQARARALRGGAVAGVLLFTGYVLQTFGLERTTPSKAGFLTGLYIPLVPVFGAMLYRRAPELSEVLGVILAGIGMALMTLGRDILSISTGDLLVAGCAVVYAFHILALEYFTRKGDTGVLAATQIAVSAALGLSVFWWAEPPRIRWTAPVLIALAVTSVFATAFAFAVQTWAQKRSSATRTALIFSLEPVFAWAVSFVLTGERLPARGVVGAALILAGIVTVELKPLRGEQHPS